MDCILQDSDRYSLCYRDSLPTPSAPQPSLSVTAIAAQLPNSHPGCAAVSLPGELHSACWGASSKVLVLKNLSDTAIVIVKPTVKLWHYKQVLVSPAMASTVLGKGHPTAPRSWSVQPAHEGWKAPWSSALLKYQPFLLTLIRYLPTYPGEEQELPSLTNSWDSYFIACCQVSK